MKTVGRYEVSNKVAEIIESLTVYPYGPYAFTINNKGVTGGLHHHTYNKIYELAKWAQKQGAEVEVICIEKGYVIIEVTDPVAASIEGFLS